MANTMNSLDLVISACAVQYDLVSNSDVPLAFVSSNPASHQSSAAAEILGRNAAFYVLYDVMLFSIIIYSWKFPVPTSSLYSVLVELWNSPLLLISPVSFENMAGTLISTFDSRADTDPSKQSQVRKNLVLYPDPALT